MFEHAWRFLKTCPKFNTMAQGKAKNGTPNKAADVIQPPIQPVDALEPGATSSIPSESQPSNAWQRPIGVKAEKHQMEQKEYMAKKMKLLEKSSNDGQQQTIEARKANEIQKVLVNADIKKMEMAIMMKNVNDCPDEASREYLIKHKAEILAKLRALKDHWEQLKKQPCIDPALGPAIPESSAPTPLVPSSSLPPTSEPKENIPSSSRPPTSEHKQNHNVIEVEDSTNNEDEEDSDPTQTQDLPNLLINPILDQL